ncbi:uncharacterized protein LOC111390615 [Olea europaea var. sylvestris]|uniref:uncharacterized protein LOC111390615 n=1 Tax=Olea europaea var. sylvestris TaxID=158386 RepID=UPI000C1D1CDF|nr:uncharacterized protein LOC111390615 [Olea europaea var. sylvestris]
MSQSANAVQTKRASCEECGADHSTVNCPILIQGTEHVDFIQGGQRQQNNPYSDTYNPSWRKHPNFSWSNQNPTAPHGRAPGTLPSNTEVNPKEHVKAITTRSGVQLPEFHVKRPTANKEKVPSTDEEHAEQTKQTTDTSIKKSSNTPQVKMPSYVKFLKDILSNKRKLEEHETIMLTEKCSARIQKKLPPKLKDPGSFTIPCTIDDYYFDKVLCDLGVSINLMPLSIFRKLGLREAKATTMTLQLADRSITHPRGIIEDILVKVDKFIFLADFLILDMEEDRDIPLILGRPFLATGRALIDFQKGQLILRLGEEHVTFNVFKAIRYPAESDSCFQIDVIDNTVNDTLQLHNPPDPYEACIIHSQSTQSDSNQIEICARNLEANPPYRRRPHFEELGTGPTKPLPSI